MNRQTCRILIVDDVAAVRLVIRKFLDRLGYRRVSEAEDGIFALPLLQAGAFDLLITDYNMPGMDGLTLLRHLRADRRTAGLPALMVTADTDRKIRIAAYAAGASAVMAKPFNPGGFQVHMDSILPPRRLAS